MAGVENSDEIEDVIETVETVENNEENDVPSNASNEKAERVIKLPLSRIRTIIKTDSDVTIASHDAVILIAKATVGIPWTVGHNPPPPDKTP